MAAAKKERLARPISLRVFLTQGITTSVCGVEYTKVVYAAFSLWRRARAQAMSGPTRASATMVVRLAFFRG